MGAFRPVTYSKKERAALNPAKLKKLKKVIVHHLETHKGIRKIVRQKTKSLYGQLKKA